jgi:hypothetical protein
MIDWNKVLEIGIEGAPAAALTLFLVWAVWFVRRLFQRIAQFFRRDRQPAQVRPMASAQPARIEPVLTLDAPSEVSASGDTDADDLKGSVDALTRRVEALERRLAAPPAPRGPENLLRVVTSEEPTPA